MSGQINGITKLEKPVLPLVNRDWIWKEMGRVGNSNIYIQKLDQTYKIRNLKIWSKS